MNTGELESADASADGAARGTEGTDPTPHDDARSNPPEWMAAKKIWLLHRQKVPYYVDGSPRQGPLGDDADLARLVTYTESLAALHAAPRGLYTGLGFALLTKEHMLGIDLDKCLAEDGATLLRHEELVRDAELLGAYIERSPSGRGLHVVGPVPEHCPPLSVNLSRSEGREGYTHNRYFTFSGDRWPESGDGEANVHGLWKASLRTGGGVQRDAILPKTEAQIARVRSALNVLTEQHGYADYDRWRNTVWSVRSLGWDCGQELALWWSQHVAGGWTGQRGFDDVWTSAPRTDGPVRTIASVFYEARQLGWADPWRPSFDLTFGELGLARAFADRHAGQYRFSCADKVWLEYRIGVWRVLDEQQQLEAAWRLLQEVRDDAMHVYSQAATNENQRALTWAMQTQRERVASAILRMASADPRIAIAGPTAFDSDPDVLNVRNGVVDLRNGALLPHDPERRMRKQACASYRPSGPRPERWLKFLDEVTGGDAEYAAYLQRAVGYMLTGRVSDEVMFFMFGFGANGKSVLCNVLQHILADYAVVLPASFLMVPDRRSGAEGASPALATLAGARLALTNETESTDQLSAQMVKGAVSIDHITARPLYSMPFTFAPTHKIVLRGNHKPIVKDTDHGLWRRLHLLPFTRTFAGDAADPLLAEKLKAESDAILSWAVAGAVEWFRMNRLRSCAAVTDATDDYQTDSDLLGLWLEEECKLDATMKVEIQEAFERYEVWCEGQGLKQPMTQPSLTKRLGERGIKVERRREGSIKKRFYIGLGLKPEESSAAVATPEGLRF